MATLLKRLWLLGLALAVACGDSSPPKITAPSLTSITVTGSDLIIVGQSETFTAVGNTGAPLSTVWWGTDAPAIVTVDPYGGPVTAVGVGTATIFVDSGGVRGTKTIRTLPNFTGTWKGLYEETGCETTGDWAALRVCSDSPYDLGIAEMTMTLTQNRDAVSGSFTLLGRRGPGGPYRAASRRTAR